MFVYFFDGLWPLEMVSLPPSASTLILTSLQFCVFSIPLQAHSPEAERKAGKQQFEALPPQYLRLVTQVARLMAIKLNL